MFVTVKSQSHDEFHESYDNRGHRKACSHLLILPLQFVHLYSGGRIRRVRQNGRRVRFSDFEEYLCRLINRPYSVCRQRV